MTHDEIVGLIKAGIPAEGGGTWADLGAGQGAFTRALRDLLGEAATLYAIDKDAGALRSHPADIHTLTANFATDTLALPPLDGLVMANALHFVMRQGHMMQRLYNLLQPGGRFIIVEYTQRLPWTPYPVPYERFVTLAAAGGFVDTAQIGRRTSHRNNVSMYAALTWRPA